MEKTTGIFLRGQYWHIDKVIKAGNKTHRLREPTGCKKEEKEQAIHVLQDRISETQHELIYGRERSFREAAVEYVLHLDRRGKSTERAETDLNLVDPHIGDLPLSHVHQGSLAPFDVAQKGVRRSSTVARAYRTTTAVLNYAARVLRQGNQPWLRTAVPKMTPPDWQDSRPPYRLTWTEQDTLAKQLADHLITPMLFGIATGAREKEIASLRWDMEATAKGLPKGSIWIIPPEIRKGNSKRAASNQKGRYLICNEMARSVIKQQRDNGSDWVFPGPNGEKMERLNNSGWRAGWKRAGLPTEGVKKGVHNLRHTFGVRLETAGVPWEYRKVLLGHEVHDVTAHYSAPGLNQLLQHAESINRENSVILRVVNGAKPHNSPTSTFQENEKTG